MYASTVITYKPCEHQPTILMIVDVCSKILLIYTFTNKISMIRCFIHIILLYLYFFFQVSYIYQCKPQYNTSTWFYEFMDGNIFWLSGKLCPWLLEDTHFCSFIVKYFIQKPEPSSVCYHLHSLSGTFSGHRDPICSRVLGYSLCHNKHLNWRMIYSASPVPLAPINTEEGD